MGFGNISTESAALQQHSVVLHSIITNNTSWLCSRTLFIKLKIRSTT